MQAWCSLLWQKQHCCGWWSPAGDSGVPTNTRVSALVLWSVGRAGAGTSDQYREEGVAFPRPTPATTSQHSLLEELFFKGGWERDCCYQLLAHTHTYCWFYNKCKSVHQHNAVMDSWIKFQIPFSVLFFQLLLLIGNNPFGNSMELSTCMQELLHLSLGAVNSSGMWTSKGSDIILICWVEE